MKQLDGDCPGAQLDLSPVRPVLGIRVDRHGDPEEELEERHGSAEARMAIMLLRLLFSAELVAVLFKDLETQAESFLL